MNATGEPLDTGAPQVVEQSDDSFSIRAIRL
jgi:hypothetical protein